MKRNKENFFFYRALALLLFAIVLTGCGKRDKALDTYKANMETYFTSVSNINNRMNQIDASMVSTPEQLQAVHNELLTSLDQFETVTIQMSELEVPEQFAMVEGLADEAAENLTESVSLYHQLYEAEEYNEGIADAAFEYYERANKRIRYIRSILQGVIPDDLNVEYEDETDSAPTQTFVVHEQGQE